MDNLYYYFRFTQKIEKFWRGQGQQKNSKLRRTGQSNVIDTAPISVIYQLNNLSLNPIWEEYQFQSLCLCMCVCVCLYVFPLLFYLTLHDIWGEYQFSLCCVCVFVCVCLCAFPVIFFFCPIIDLRC